MLLGNNNPLEFIYGMLIKMGISPDKIDNDSFLKMVQYCNEPPSKIEIFISQIRPTLYFNPLELLN